jgi:uncharacterized cupredoxin-like copper-binding protein
MIRNRRGSLALVAVTAALAGGPSAAAQPQTASAAVVGVTAGLPGEFKYKLSKATVPKGKVTFIVTNRGNLPHDFKIAGKKTRVLQKGQSQRLIVTFKKAGRFQYLCAVSGHALAGMKGFLRVK